ncbi:PREDICTED: coiled-coil domain-containing protein 110 [Tinamus guttatus]|uniref:coiled-coil domain-containing protein 110 n=1 Tax=Tinamus guttatus TaxID=94827 RepID=UPI00052E7C69|nr:PREDICTED: coiled-coil domain-containing protein 110 [Tinamus guttatus]
MMPPQQILQQQLESFKTLRQQILENVNMVQSEISEILNKNIIEMKTPQCSSGKILMISTPSDVCLPAENPESSLSNKKVHHDQQAACKEQAESESKTVHKEFRSNYSEGESFQLNFFSQMVKDELITLDHKKHLAKEQSLSIFNETLLRLENQKFTKIQVPCEHDEKTEGLQKSLKNSEHLQNRVHDLETENLLLKNKVKPLNITIQSLKEKVSIYNKQIRDLVEEKKRMQSQLVKSEDDSKESIKEVKKLLRRCKELQNQKNILEEERTQLYNGNQRTIQALKDFQIKNQKVEEEMTVVTCEKERLNATLESLQKERSMLQEANKKLEIDTSQLMKEKNSLEGELERNQSEIQQMREKETATKSELETLLQLTQALEDKKNNLEMTLQECSNTKEMLQKDFEKVQFEKAHTEKKLMTELRYAKADIDLLKSNLTNADRERERLSTAITNITEENQLLKKELQEYRQGASKYESDIRKLTEERLLLENHLRSVENERDVLQFEFRHLHNDYAYLRGRATALARGQSKPGCSSGITQDNCYSEYSPAISDPKHAALECQSQGFSLMPGIVKSSVDFPLKLSLS